MAISVTIEFSGTATSSLHLGSPIFDAVKEQKGNLTQIQNDIQFDYQWRAARRRLPELSFLSTCTCISADSLARAAFVLRL